MHVGRGERQQVRTSRNRKPPRFVSRVKAGAQQPGITRGEHGTLWPTNKRLETGRATSTNSATAVGSSGVITVREAVGPRPAAIEDAPVHGSRSVWALWDSSFVACP